MTLKELDNHLKCRLTVQGRRLTLPQGKGINLKWYQIPYLAMQETTNSNHKPIINSFLPHKARENSPASTLSSLMEELRPSGLLVHSIWKARIKEMVSLILVSLNSNQTIESHLWLPHFSQVAILRALRSRSSGRIRNSRRS